MTVFEVLILSLTFGVGYFIGKSIKKAASQKNSKYAPLQQKDLESCDENEMNFIQTKSYFVNDDYEENQKTIDKLMQDLNDAKKREKKYQAEIEILKNQTKNKDVKSTPQEESGPLRRREVVNKDLDDLINDQELNSLIDASARIEPNEIIDTDKLNQEIEDDLEGNYLE